MAQVANFNLVQRILEVNYFSDLKLQIGRVFRPKTSGHGLNQIPQTLLNTSQVVVLVWESLRSLEIRGKLIVARCAPNSVLIGLPYRVNLVSRTFSAAENVFVAFDDEFAEF